MTGSLFRFTNSVQIIDSKDFVCEHIEHGIADNEIVTVSTSDVPDSLKAVKLGKAAGIDGLSAEHFVCAHIGISVIISYIYVDSWTHARRVNENGNCSHAEKKTR